MTACRRPGQVRSACMCAGYSDGIAFLRLNRPRVRNALNAKGLWPCGLR
jgi:hypothetical protein